MSKINITNNMIESVTNLLTLLNSSSEIDTNKYDFKNINSTIYLNLPYFDNKNFNISNIINYIETSILLNIPDLRQQLLQNFKTILSINFNKDHTKYFKGIYAIHIPDIIQANKLSEIIESQIKEQNFKYYQNIINILNPIMIDKYNLHEYNVQSNLYANKCDLLDISIDICSIIDDYYNETNHAEKILVNKETIEIPTIKINQENKENKENKNIVINLNNFNESIDEDDTMKSNIDSESDEYLFKYMLDKKKYIEKSVYNKIETPEFDNYTYDLLKVVPFDNKNIIFSGGLLFDIIRSNNKFDYKKLIDIDLFLFGDNNRKLATIETIISNIKKTYGEQNIFVGMNYSVIDIFIKSIPRIIQIVCTDYDTAEDCIDRFDFYHLMSYYDGITVYSNEKAVECLKNNMTSINKNIQHPSFLRIIKTLNRGLKIDNYNKNFNIITMNDFYKYNKYNDQIELYKITNNLTDEYNDEKLFRLFDVKTYDQKKLILNGNFRRYNKSTEKEQKTNIGQIADYKLVKFNYEEASMYLYNIKCDGFEPIIFTKATVITKSSDRFKSGHYTTLIEVKGNDFYDFIIEYTKKIKEMILQSDRSVNSKKNINYIFTIPFKHSKLLSNETLKELTKVKSNFNEYNDYDNICDTTFDKYLDKFNGVIINLKSKNELNVKQQQEISIILKTRIYCNKTTIGCRKMCGFHFNTFTIF